MATCAICSTPLKSSNMAVNNELRDGGRLCLSCINKLDLETSLNLKNLTTEEVLFKIGRQKLFSEEIKKPQNGVVEYRRTCLQCGKVWHSLASREKYLDKEKKWNNCNMCASAFGTAGGNSYSWGTWTQTKRNEHALDSEISKLKQCPNCMSSNYAEEKIVYEKQ